MPKFPKNTGFKLPGIGSREIDTPGNFRKGQKVEDVGYCDNTESHMLPPGSSPLLAKREDHHDTGWLIPPVDKPSFTGSVDTSTKRWPTKGKEDDGGGDDGGKEPVIDVVTQDPGEDGGGRLASYQEAWENDLEGIRSNSGPGKGYDRMKNQLIEQGKLKSDANAYDAYVYEQTNLGSNESAHKETHRNVAKSNPAGQVYGVDNLGVKQDKAQKALDQMQKQCEEQGGTYNRTTGKCN